MSFYILHASYSSAALLLSIMGLWFAIVIPGIDRWSKRFFVLYFTIFMLCCLSGIAEIAFQSYIVPSAVFCTLLLLESLLFMFSRVKALRKNSWSSLCSRVSASLRMTEKK